GLRARVLRRGLVGGTGRGDLFSGFRSMQWMGTGSYYFCEARRGDNAERDVTGGGGVGAGAVSPRAPPPVLSEEPGGEIVAVCDNDRPKARALADRFGVPDVFTDIEDLLEADQLDAVVIATPNHLHEPHAIAALAAGAHVLCERPLALTSRGVERILSAA